MKVVALAGESGVGKSTLARLHFRPLGYLDVALADELKVRAIATGVATYEDVYVGTKPPAVRTWLQEEGTERGRAVFGEDVWCRALFARLRKAEEDWGADQFVITDVRFPNEARYVREQGGIVLRVDAPRRASANALNSTQRQHASETALASLTNEDFDGVLFNDLGDEATVAWQVQAHLYIARFGQRSGRLVMNPRRIPAFHTETLTLAQRCSLLARMFPQFDWNAED